MTVQEKNYWITTAEMPRIETRPLPEKVDVAILGAGFTGLSAARTLAKLGARVAVLEAETVGWGASSRNGGMVLTGLKLGAGDLISRYGKETTRRMFWASLEAISTVEQIVADEKIDCDFCRCGHLEVANKPSHFDAFKRSAETMERELNHSVQVVPREDLFSEIGSKVYFGGLVDEISAGANPARYVAGLARAAVRAGAEVHERSRVEKIELAPHNGAPGWKMSTARGVSWARDVLVATSGYTGDSTPSLRRKLIPVGSTSSSRKFWLRKLPLKSVRAIA